MVHPAKEEGIGLVEVLDPVTMQVFVREHCTMIAAPAQQQSGSIVFDMKDPSQIPAVAVAEPWFLAFNAQVSLRLIMNPHWGGRVTSCQINPSGSISSTQ